VKQKMFLSIKIQLDLSFDFESLRNFFTDRKRLINVLDLFQK